MASPWLWPRRERPSESRRDALAPLADLLARAGVPSVLPLVLIGVIAMAGIAGEP